MQDSRVLVKGSSFCGQGSPVWEIGIPVFAKDKEASTELYGYPKSLAVGGCVLSIFS
ncbi:hypothetical protein [Sporosarcina sp. YIM B06819]|uniref:hypothetical protein n=1 Tax=Sporosarcina sp. YIM B06819 TaxID=3081769 RepID=UPI00298CD226|nr:hypothetical protein [Sporosarcina sp. YIM B06819]